MEFVMMIISSYLFFVVLSRRREQECYAIDYECFKPSDDRIVSTQLFRHLMNKYKNVDVELPKFLAKIILNADIGYRSYAPRSIFTTEQPNLTLADTTSELDEFFHDTIQKLFNRLGISPSDIDVLVVSISMLTLVPSFTARIINHYKLRDDIKVFNLSGMGCSANLISVDLVRNIFTSHKNLYALVVSAESLSPHLYEGKNKSMILSNSLFRSSGCVLALTNNPSLKHKAMYKLKYLVRTHHGASDDAYGCCI